jgi:hypothetical protein
MKRYVIERNMPGVGGMSLADLKGGTARSNDVLKELGTDVQWIQSYVTADKIFCVYLATDPELVAEHARRSGFPADAIHEVRATIDPTNV